MIAKSRNSKTIFCATRYGNVMGTRGSVIPLFVSQINNNLPTILVATYAPTGGFGSGKIILSNFILLG